MSGLGEVSEPTQIFLVVHYFVCSSNFTPRTSNYERRNGLCTARIPLSIGGKTGSKSERPHCFEAIGSRKEQF